MVTVDAGRHRRPESVMQARAGMPLSPAGWPRWDAGSPLMHPDHPSAPVPRVRSETAEQEAARLRAVIVSLSDQLSQMAAHLTEDLAAPATRPTRSITRPARPATRHARPARLTTRHARPVTKPATSTTRPTTGAQGRQARAARKMVALLAALATVGVASGAAELALHGGPFFIFRANGAGASETGPVENQGPGQPDAPGAHHVPAPPRHAK
jgi:hypothetical protein